MCTDSGVGCPFDIACLYVAVWSLIYAGSVFGSDCVGIGGVLSSGGVVLCYGLDYGHCSGGAIWRFRFSFGYDGIAGLSVIRTYVRIRTGRQSLIWIRHLVCIWSAARLLYRLLTFWVDRLGEEPGEKSRRWRQQSTCRGTRAFCCPIFRFVRSSLHRCIECRRRWCPLAWDGWCSMQKRSQTSLQHHGRCGPPSTWRRWVCGAHKRVRVIPGQCRPRPATLAWTVGTVFRRVGSLRSIVYSSSANQSSYWNIMVWNMMQWSITEQFLPVGCMLWLCNIYIGLAIREVFKLVLCFKFGDVMCL